MLIFYPLPGRLVIGNWHVLVVLKASKNSTNSWNEEEGERVCEASGRIPFADVCGIGGTLY